MHQGRIEFMSEEDLGRMFAAVTAVLEKTGLRVEHPEVRRRLEAAGAHTSDTDALVRLPQKLLLDTLALYRGHPSQKALREAPFPETFSVSLGDGCFFLDDYESRTRRKATEADFVRVVHFANATEEITAIDAPMELGDAPVPLMVVRMLALLYLHTTLPCGVENNIPEQIPHLAALRDVYNHYHDVPAQLGNAQGITSPLIFGKRAGQLLLEGMKHDFAHGTYTMAIAGANAPVTVAGCAVQAAAELMGSMTCVAVCDPERLASMLVLTGTMDMRTGKALFASPGAVRQNMSVTELFRRLHGVEVSSNWPWYTDAVSPGLQCAMERQTKQLLYAAHSGRPVFHVGDLDGGSAFSPEQAVIDLDVSRGVWETLRPRPFDETSLAVDEIDRAGAAHGATHLATDYTLARHRAEIWSPRVLPHDYWRENGTATSEREILAASHEHYERTVAACEPAPLPKGFERDIVKVLGRAHDELGDLPLS